MPDLNRLIVTLPDGLQLEVIARRPSELDETRTHEVELTAKQSKALTTAIKKGLAKADTDSE